MGKKGSWFSAIKKVFTHSSKEKVADRTEKKTSKEKEKKGFGKLKHGDGHSFIPLFRKPSSIEKILGEAERNYAPPEQPKALPHVITPPPHPPKVAASPRTSTSSRIASPPRDAAQPIPPRTTPPPTLQRVASTSPPRVATRENGGTPARAPSPRFVRRHGPEPTLKEQHIWATKIQAAYRGHMARRSGRAVRGMVRLQAVVKGQSVKRQTANAMKCMQFLVRVQTQIQSRRIQMFENQALHKNDKNLESIFSKSNLSENQDEWEDRTLTKQEVDARMQRKVDAIVKRERAMAYAYSHQLGKSTPRTALSALMNNIRSGGFPYWWNWLEQPQGPPPRTPTNPSQTPSMKSFSLTPSKPRMGFRASSPLGQPSNSGQLRLGFDNLDTPSPRSTKSAVPSSRAKLARTPPGRLQKKFSMGSTANSPFNGGGGFRDDDSLMSCPPFSGPRYMSPTASVKAKARGGKEQFPDSPSSITSECNRRSSFPLGRDQFIWNKNKGPLFFNKETGSQKSLKSVGNLSVDSTVSMPATIGRKPFNRFV